MPVVPVIVGGTVFVVNASTVGAIGIVSSKIIDDAGSV